ncbi:MAG: hypothetical protein H3C62_04630 [Gemmatimonadaceae bacterium]|nr:hypothetical protein [Gemmatimonadaceae bacterium]
MTASYQRRPEGPRPWREAPIDDSRALRATLLSVVPTSDRGIFEVHGGEAVHYVNFRDRDVPLCCCGDHIARDTLCKHAVAVLLRERNRHARRAVRRAAIAENAALGVRRAAPANACYDDLCSSRGFQALPVPWQVDASGAWHRPARTECGDETVVVRFVPGSKAIRSSFVVPF